MALYKQGDKIVNRKTLQKGFVVEVAPPSRGKQLYKVIFAGDSEAIAVTEINLMPDYDVTDPFVCCKQNVYGSQREYSQINTSFKISNSNNNSISSLKASKTQFKPYQFIPLLKFLNSDKRRLLIADEVGLGKTIEAGHIMLELKARRELKDVLIVCPKSLKVKWKDELESRFGLKFVIYGSAGEVTDDLRAHRGIVRGIVNYEMLRRGKTSGKDDSPKPNKILDYLSENNIRLSMVVCDEAHKLRNHNTQTAAGLEEVLASAVNALFLTATPIMTSNENLYNQLHLLDPETYNDAHIFANNLSINGPFLDAIRGLQQEVPLKKIADNLKHSDIITYSFYGDYYTSNTHTIEEYFKDFPIYQQIIADMESVDDAGSHELRASLQFNLNQMSVLNNIFSRTRRRDVVTDLANIVKRVPHDVRVHLYNDEKARFTKVIDKYIDENSYIGEDGERKMQAGTALALTTKKRQVSSSVYGYLNDVEDLENGIDAFQEFPDKKVEMLITLLDRIKTDGNGKLIVFCGFVNTIKYLEIRLRQRGVQSESIYGGIVERAEAINRFKNNDNIHVLLSSQVGGEGLDLQFCDALVNYDLPWNPMDIEQRIGRIDRFGQMSEKINIYNFVVAGSIQEQIYDRLLKRIGIFEESIGDLEAILDGAVLDDFGGKSVQESIGLIEKQLYENRMSDVERGELLDRIAQAIKLEERNLKEVEDGLTNTLTNDAYFRQEIERIRDNNAYVTEHELVTFFRLLHDTHPDLAPCKFNEIRPHVFRLTLPQSNNKALANFLMANEQSNTQEDDIMFQQFLQRIDGEASIDLTFDQDTAYNDGSIIYANIYHPLIIAANQYLRTKESKIKTFCFDIPFKAVSKKLQPGKYFLAVYRISTSKLVLKQGKTSNVLYPMLYDIDSGNLMDNRLAEFLMGKAQAEAVCHTPYEGDFPAYVSVDDMQIDFTERIEDRVATMYEESEVRENNYIMKQERLIEEQYETRVSRIQETIDRTMAEAGIMEEADYARNMRLHKGRLEATIREKEEKIKALHVSNELTIKHNLLSLNLVFIV